jgi:hypothetical protein
VSSHSQGWEDEVSLPLVSIRDHEKITSLSEKEVIEWWMP